MTKTTATRVATMMTATLNLATTVTLVDVVNNDKGDASIATMTATLVDVVDDDDTSYNFETRC